jgi:hypothetical protein
MYRDPYLGFGGAMSDVKAYEKRSISSEDSDGIIYLGENSYLTALMYLFENSVYSSSSTLVPTAYGTLLGSYYGERYIYLGTVDDIITMVSPDYKTIIGIGVYSVSFYMVLYMKNTYITRSADSSLYPIELNEILTKVKSIKRGMPSIKLQSIN